MADNLLDQNYSDAFACALVRIDRLGPNRRTHFYRASCRGRLSKRDGEADHPCPNLADHRQLISPRNIRCAR